MLILPGAPALSEFRTQKLLSSLQALQPGISSVYAEYVHFADLSDALTAIETEVLVRLLTYGPKADKQAGDGQLLLAVPRPGTISPWSSKATDIAHNAGVAKVNRIERGIAYHIDG